MLGLAGRAGHRRENRRSASVCHLRPACAALQAAPGSGTPRRLADRTDGRVRTAPIRPVAVWYSPLAGESARVPPSRYLLPQHNTPPPPPPPRTALNQTYEFSAR